MTHQRIALITDFGYEDAYVGMLKGVISARAPQAQILDITHGIPAGNIRWGAYTLMTSLSFFPPETVILGVVDPGVGSSRRGLCIQTEKFVLVGPDNGLFSFALREHPPLACYSIENPACFLEPVSQTFHGRDIFAPVAAQICAGMPISNVGPLISDWQAITWPEPKQTKTEIQGEILLHDHFGNLISNLSRSQVADFCKDAVSQHQALHCEIEIGGVRLLDIQPIYAAVPPQTLLALWGSSDLLEISINQGNAQKQLGVKVGDRIYLRKR
jgi:S-adenosyl-L-methionine hydrolase (adenosine-forming)